MKRFQCYLFTNKAYATSLTATLREGRQFAKLLCNLVFLTQHFFTLICKRLFMQNCTKKNAYFEKIIIPKVRKKKTQNLRINPKVCVCSNCSQKLQFFYNISSSARGSFIS